MNIEHEIALIERVNYSWRHKFCTKITSISDQINRYAIIPQTIFPQQIFRTHESEILNHWKSRKVLTFEEQNRHGDVGLHVEEERRITRCVKRYHRTTKLLLHYKQKRERISWIFCLFTTDCDRSGLERQFGWKCWLGNCWKSSWDCLENLIANECERNFCSLNALRIRYFQRILLKIAKACRQYTLRSFLRMHPSTLFRSPRAYSDAYRSFHKRLLSNGVLKCSCEKIKILWLLIISVTFTKLETRDK